VTIDEIYTLEWFREGYKAIRPEIKTLADHVATLKPPCRVIDVGCGPGLLIERLSELGYNVQGYDGAAGAIQYAREMTMLGERVVRHDLLERWEEVPPFDLVICTEVAEHIARQDSAALVACLSRHLGANGLVFFTAAPPGQGGTDHRNERPMIEWLELFSRHYIFPDLDRTLDMRKRLSSLERVWWYARNAVVLARQAP
jgi:2-polyprenyl-3-methyl-5-hydroxy-6-metoxy-1,4-benzoquinol methylase